MAPSTSKTQGMDFETDEKCLCFHGEYLYEAKIMQVEQTDSKDKKSPWRYKVHYKGWKNTWDDWVDAERLRKLNDENKEFAKSLFADLRQKQREEREAKEVTKKASLGGGGGGAQKKKSGAGSELGGGFRGSEDRSSSVQAPTRGTKRARDWEIEKEETFAHRPSIRIPIPDTLKGLLVDDWENVTKSLLLVPLPHPHPITTILSDYTASEATKRRPGSADADVLEEVVQGIKEYFDKSLGRILLYRFERQQWLEIHERISKENATTTTKLSSSPPQTTSATETKDPTKDTTTTTEPDHSNLTAKSPSDIYGAEHLCRLFVSMPELIAQTNMDAQSVARLREELAKVTAWLGRNAQRYFARGYVEPGVEYGEKAKGTG